MNVGLVLDELLGTSMQEADMRIGSAHDLTIELKDETQYTVGSWMLRTKVEDDVLSRGLFHLVKSFNYKKGKLSASEIFAMLVA